ncbi:hypothetical protein D7V83_00685 [bacterium 0.1xD8-71]|nr:hypothetical protein D7V83_00685 [bacterium 0.1xD8-71]
MADKNEDASNVMTFDALYTTNQIQKLKVLLPYIEPSMQKHLAIYIKYMELQYTMDYVRRHPFQLCGCGLSTPEKPDLCKLCRELCLYSTPEEIRQLEQFQNMLKTLETVQEMSQTMSAMQEIFPDMNMDFGNPFSGNDTSPEGNEGSGTFQGAPMLDMLMNMLSPEQKAMYEMFQNNPPTQ